MPFPRAASCPYISPSSGSLEMLGAESRGYFSPGSRPRNPKTGVPWPVVTQNVCARVQVWVYVCAFFACLFRELRSRVGGGWQWDVKFTITQRRKESGGRARRAPDWGNLSVGEGGINHTGWRSSVLRC